MTTYATMRARIQDEIDDSSITSNVNEAIQSAIKFYERKKFWFNQKTDTLSTVASQEYYGAAANADIPYLLEIKSMVAGSPVAPLYAAPFAAIDAVQTGLVTGQPSYFAYFNSQIRLYPIPDAVYTVTMAYHYRFAALSADADTNSWMTDAEELIRLRAKRILALNKQWDFEMYALLEGPEMEALSALQGETKRRRSQNRLLTELPNPASFDINAG